MRDEERIRRAAEKQLAMMRPTLEKIEQIRRDVAKAAQTVDPALRQAQQNAALVAHTFRRINYPKISALGAMIARSMQSLRDSLPSNWDGGFPAEIAILLDCADGGIPVTWVPPLEVIVALAEAEPAMRFEVLTSNAEPILAAVRGVADQLQSTYGATSNALMEAVNVIEGGHFQAGQTLASSIVSHVLVHDFQFPHLSAARKAISTGDVNDVAVIEFRALLTLRPVRSALGQFEPTAPVPTSFNRHATAHSVSPEQLNEVNALVALMLAASLATESAHSAGDVDQPSR